METIALLDYVISSGGLARDTATALDFIKSGQTGKFLACANPHSLFIASKDAQFARALKNADILLPDGSGIILAAKLLDLPLYERVAGYEFFTAVNVEAQQKSLKYFFLGSRDEVLDKICARLHTEYPSIEIRGTYSPPYKEEFNQYDNAVMIDRINKAKPDILWVGMTAPKQEKWIFQNKYRLNVPLIGAIGAVFDFYAGTVKRPVPFLQKLGLEWLGRLVREPRRLWRRNLISAPAFLYWITKEKAHRLLEGHNSVHTTWKV